MNIKNEEQFQVKKLEIIKGYSEMVTDMGIENVSMSKLSKRLGIPSSLIFYYFDNKAQLIEEMVDYALNICGQHISFSEKSIDGLPTENTFKEYISMLFTTKSEIDSYDTKLYFTCYSLALRNQTIRNKFCAHQEKMRIGLKNALKYFASNNIIEINNLDKITDILYCMISGTVNMTDFIPNKERISEIQKQNMAVFLDYIKCK